MKGDSPMLELRIEEARVEDVALGDGRRGFVVTLFDDGGRGGLGEATPLSGFSPEDVASCAQALHEVSARVGAAWPAMRGTAPALATTATPKDEVASWMDRFAPGLDRVPSARFALETALLDLLGQQLRLSVAASLGGACAYAEVPVNGLAVAADGPEVLVEAGHALVARGMRCLKVKLRGRDDAAFAAELEALRALRRAVEPPGGLELRLDANGVWSLEEARRRLDALAPLRPRFVEQPVAAEALDQLGPCAVPWAADESLGVPGMAERLLEADGCVAFVLKPAALGLLRAHTLGTMAQARGLGVVVTHFMDGPVALAAACELALGLPSAPLACGLDVHAGLRAWPSLPVPQRRLEGVVVASGRAGLGVAS
ncbi:mandelate racemase/muconate lactonizing enzyme family protein [Chondromyces crocatus]|uniref:O-succinylbenzoate synthase n=1 Tax=Chondromyces crocatus TaxID=52 RepID=A0A0K1EH66_CHOCO|nr:enolase C-terminal domain-like protein [Chondromyces crocatus]AKT40206.1 O-succinylbenzoate synthase [Chondromyces crocatus]